MSVPIAVVGLTPKTRTSSGVISDPPPIPVSPTRKPTPKPKKTIAGSMPMALPGDPGSLVLGQREHLGRDVAVAQVGDCDRLQDAAQARADSDPDVGQLLRRPGVLGRLGGVVLDVGQGPFNGANQI